MKPALRSTVCLHEHVEAALGNVANDGHLGVLVPLAQRPALALFDVGRPPRAVEVMEGHQAGLDVGAHSHLLRRAHQHRYRAGPTGGEQLGLGPVVAGLVHEADLALGHAAAHQVVP